MRLTLGLVICCLSCVSLSYGDVLHLKSGDKIEGNILQSTDQWTVIQTGAKVLKYEASQIESVETDNIVAEAGPELLTDDKRALIKSLLKANGVEKILEQNAKTVIAQAPEDRREKLQALFQSDQLMDLIVPVYSEKFSSQELEKLINFFNSPTGRKYVSQSGQITEETFQILLKYFAAKVAFPGA